MTTATVKASASRDATMAKLYRDGWTLERIGGECGLTRERVRQILARDHVPKRTWRRRYTREALAAAVVGYNAGTPLPELAARLGVGIDAAKTAIGEAGGRRPPRQLPPHGTAARYGYHGCRCRTCRDSNNVRHAQIMDRLLAAGRCARCPRKRVNATYCERHRKLVREWFKQRNEKRQALGLCRRCDRRTVTTLRHCAEHAAEHNAYRRERNRRVAA